jgi:internalin A
VTNRQWWDKLDSFGAAWRKELTREMSLADGTEPSDAQLAELIGRSDILIYVSGGKTNLTPLSQFDALEDVGLDGHASLGKLELLTKLPSLRALSLRKDNLRDVSFLASLTKLEKLDLSQNEKLADIAPLAKLTRLTELQLGYTAVSDLGPLSSLKALRKLTLFHGRVADLSPLAKLSKLENLDINDNPFSDLTPLGKLASLKSLDVCGGEKNAALRSIAPLSTLAQLQYLNITWQPVEDLAPLAGCKALEELRAVVNVKPTNLEALLGLPRLKRVLMYRSHVGKKDREAFAKTRPKLKLELR